MIKQKVKSDTFYFITFPLAEGKIKTEMGQVIMGGIISEHRNLKEYFFVFEEDENYILKQVVKAKVFGKDRKFTLEAGKTNEREYLMTMVSEFLKNKLLQSIRIKPDKFTKEEKLFVRELLVSKLKEHPQIKKVVEDVLADGIGYILRDRVNNAIAKLKERKALPQNFASEIENSLTFHQKSKEIAERFIAQNPKVKEDLTETLARSIATEMLKKGDVRFGRVLKEKEKHFLNYSLAIVGHFKESIEKLVKPRDIIEIVEDIVGKNIEEIVGIDEKKLAKELARLGEEKTEEIRRIKAKRKM